MSRVGGIFPLPFQSAATGDGAICLPSGGVYVFPAGNWAVTLGVNTVCQWMDPQAQKWRTLNADFLSSDGCNYRLVNTSGSVIGATVSAAGSGGANGIGVTSPSSATLTFSASPAGANATATGYAIVGGSVAAPTVTQGGSGFLMPPLIMIDPPPPGGVQATAVASINASGVVTGITMVNAGAGYTAPPNFWVVPQMPTWQGGPIDGTPAAAFPPPGTVYPTNLPTGIGAIFQNNLSPLGCQLTPVALTGSGTVTGLNLISGGWGYTAAATATIAGAGAATAAVVMAATVPGVPDTSYVQSRVQ